jgi:hypothetical protein
VTTGDQKLVPFGVGVSVLAAGAVLLLGGCTTQVHDKASSPSPTVSAPPSTPVKETTLRDDVLGTTVTPLAIVTGFDAGNAAPDVTVPGVEIVLVEVRVHAGSKYQGSLYPDLDLSITADHVDLDYVNLQGTDPGVKTAMQEHGYDPLGDVAAGTTKVGWIGGAENSTDKAFQLIYHRGSGVVVGGTKANGKKLAASQSIASLVPTSGS